MTTAVAPTVITVHLNSTKEYIRKLAKKDLPKLGVKAEQTYYLVRSSENNGKYYVVTWSYEQVRWTCSCPAHIHNCRHVKVASAAAREFAVNPTLPLINSEEGKDLTRDIANIFKAEKPRKEKVRRSAVRTEVVTELSAKVTRKISIADVRNAFTPVAAPVVSLPKAA